MLVYQTPQNHWAASQDEARALCKEEGSPIDAWRTHDVPTHKKQPLLDWLRGISAESPPKQEAHPPSVTLSGSTEGGQQMGETAQGGASILLRIRVEPVQE